MKFKVIKKLEIRSDPTFKRGVSFGTLKPGFIIDAIDYFNTGDSIDIWLKDKNGFFYWKGALEEAKLKKTADNIELNLNYKAPWLNDNFDVSSFWGKSTGKGITVAIIDSGIYPHKDLKKNIDTKHQKYFIGNSIIDNDGHGTHVAGIIGANGRHSIIGVAPKVKLLPIKVVENHTKRISNYILTDAIDYVTSLEHVNIINLSLKANHNNAGYARLKSSIKKAISKGKIVVCASGNDWGNFVASPANIENVISVSAIQRLPLNTETYQVPSFSNYGKKVNTCCIGYDVLSCGLNDQSNSLKSGTSMASAYLSGVLALKLQNQFRRSKSYSHAQLINDINNNVFGYAHRKNDINISLPILNPIKFLMS